MNSCNTEVEIVPRAIIPPNLVDLINSNNLDSMTVRTVTFQQSNPWLDSAINTFVKVLVKGVAIYELSLRDFLSINFSQRRVLADRLLSYVRDTLCKRNDLDKVARLITLLNNEIEPIVLSSLKIRELHDLEIYEDLLSWINPYALDLIPPEYLVDFQ